MVVGAYTIINTIGLLVGLPLNLSTNKLSIDINHNIDIITTDNITNYALILDTKNASEFNFPSDNSYTLTLNFSNRAHDYVLDNSLTQGNYLFFVPDADNSITNPYTIDIDFTGLVFNNKSLVINQVYIASLTSSLSTLNGSSVINSITNGLGLMGDITTNFKNGFSALIWNSQENTLTTFGNFALIFLGVSITFAIVKLCLNLIRSKTGA